MDDRLAAMCYGNILNLEWLVDQNICMNLSISFMHVQFWKDPRRGLIGKKWACFPVNKETV